MFDSGAADWLTGKQPFNSTQVLNQGPDWQKIAVALGGGLIGGGLGALGQPPVQGLRLPNAPSAGIMGGHMGQFSLPQVTPMARIAQYLLGHGRGVGG